MNAAAPVSDSALRGRMTRGFLWKLASQIVDQASRTVMAVILARMLTPSEFGLAGMAFIFANIALIFTDLSLGSALVQRVTITDRDRSTVFWTTTAGGVLIAAVGWFSAPAIGAFFNESEVTSLFRVLSLTFVLTALSATQVSLLTRDMAFRRLELREMAGGGARAVTAIAMAVAGFGAWSIVGGAVAASSVSLVMLWTASSWRPGLMFSFASLRDLGSYGIKAFASRIFQFITENADNLLVGRFLGPASLGVYGLAYNAMLSPLARVVAPVAQVLFPALSRIQTETDRLVGTWLRTTVATAAIMLPAFTGIILVTPEIVNVVFGSKWDAAVPVLRLLCVGGLATSLMALNQSVLQSRNRPGTMLRFSILVTVASVVGYIVGLHWGILGVAASVAIVRTSLLPLNALLACRAVSIRLRTYFATFRGIVEATLLMALALLALRQVLGTGIPPAGRLLIQVIVGFVVYAAGVMMRERDLVAEIRRLRAA